MKKAIKLFGFIAMVAIIGFSITFCGCGAGDDTNGVSGGDGSLGGASITKTYTTTHSGSQVTFNHAQLIDGSLHSFSDIFNTTANVDVNVTGTGTLTVKLDALKTANLVGLTSELPGVTATPSDLKINTIDYFKSKDPGTEKIHWRKPDDSGFVVFVYANKDGIATGSFFDGGGTVTVQVALTLKQGWNTVMQDMTSPTTGKLVSGVPGAGYR